MFNNVEEIPDAIEKFCPFPRPPSVCARSRTAEGARAFDIEWFALETNRDHSVIFEVASKHCISDSFVDHDGYSIS